MTIVEGQIESLKKLKEILDQNGITRFNSIGEIDNFIKNYDFEKKKISIIFNKWKYIYNETKKHELYNLQTDSSEKNNVIDTEKEIADELLNEILNHINKLNTSKKERSDKHKIVRRIKQIKTQNII